MKTILTFLTLSCVCTLSFADGKTAKISVPSESGPLAFAAGEIESALKSAGWNITRDDAAAFDVILEVPNGTEKMEEKPESFKIEVSQDSGITQVRIRGTDVRGAMYGGLDVAEQIRMNGPLSVKSKNESPFLSVRAMKFNPPLKGNVYMSEEDGKNSAWFYDLQYWDQFMRTMAYNRYNAITFWSSHPYDQIVRLQKYPEATTLPKDQLDKNIAHFHKIFQMAKSYGLDTYLITWNIHMSAGFRAAHKVRDGQDSPLIRDYQKECIRELLREYPELTGMGTCPGENMPMSAVANAEWIRDVYLDTLAKTGRKIPFIYRYWFADPNVTADMMVKEKYPGALLLDIKYNGEHMYSSTKPHPEEMRWLTQEQRPYKFLWHLRNDCIYQLRWGDPEFAGKTLSNCGGADSAGFVMGSEVEIPGADRNHTSRTVEHRDWKFEFEKNWMRFAVWGRMGYNPQESENYWIGRFAERFGSAASKDAFLALKHSSKIIPTVTSFHWNYMNSDWYPEGNVGVTNYSAGMKKSNFREDGIFHDIHEWIFNNVIDDSMMSIPDYVAACIAKDEKAPAGVLTPLEVATMLENATAESEKHAQAAAATIEKGTKEWECTQLDLQASAALGRYYAAKIRAGVDLMTYLATGDEARKSAAVATLEKAKEYWKSLAAVTQSHYRTHEVWLMGQFDWTMYLAEVEKDIEMARNTKPWTKDEQTWILTNGERVNASARWQAEGWSKEIEPWVDEFNLHAKRSSASLDIAAGSWIKTTINTSAEGTSIIHVSPAGVKEIKVNGASYFPQADGQPSIVAKLRSGDNEIAVQYESALHVVPLAELEMAPALIFLEAEDGQLTPPMRKLARKDASGGAIIVTPRGSGRGEINGKVLDNGFATYKITIPKDGNYRMHALVFWENGDKDSFFYAWDDGKPILIGNDNVFGKWHWIHTESKPLSAGEHALVVRNREEDAVLDCMTVTADKSEAK